MIFGQGVIVFVGLEELQMRTGDDFAVSVSHKLIISLRLMTLFIERTKHDLLTR